MKFFLKKLFFLDRYYKIFFFVFFDFILSTFSIWFSFCLRLGEFYNPLKIDITLYIAFFLIFIAIQIYSKSYLQLSRFFSISSINNLLKIFLILFFSTYFFKILFLKNIFLPQSIFLIYPIVFFIVSLFKNSLIYNLYHYVKDSLNFNSKKVLFYGFDDETINYIESYKKHNFSIVGIVKLPKNSIRSYEKKFNFIREDQIGKYISKEKITDIIVSKNNNYYSKIFYFKKFLDFNVRVSFLNEINNIQDLNKPNKLFEPKIDDIIGRNNSDDNIKKKLIKEIKNKVILVAGGAGSIGSNLIERLHELSPKKIIVIDKDEFNIFDLKKKFINSKKLICKLSDTSNKFFLEKIYKQFNPHIVYNAAAYKHVSIVEENIEYAVLNNIKTAINICELSVKYKTKISLLVSTDKAVNPKSIMGMSKNLCEKVYQCFSDINKKNQKFIIVRFGNVAGSKGSVLPYFQKLIHLKQTIPVTSKKATRYLMSIREAANLIIKASIIGNNSKIYVLDMGIPINIYNLAYNLIKFNGLSLKNKNNPTGDIAINIVGLKKGEKIHEKLTDKSDLIKTKYSKIFLCDEKLKDINFKVKFLKFISEIKLNTKESFIKNKIKTFL